MKESEGTVSIMGTQHLVCEVQATAEETLQHAAYNTAQRKRMAVHRMFHSDEKDNHR